MAITSREKGPRCRRRYWFLHRQGFAVQYRDHAVPYRLLPRSVLGCLNLDAYQPQKQDLTQREE